MKKWTSNDGTSFGVNVVTTTTVRLLVVIGEVGMVEEVATEAMEDLLLHTELTGGIIGGTATPRILDRAGEEGMKCLRRLKEPGGTGMMIMGHLDSIGGSRTSMRLGRRMVSSPP